MALIAASAGVAALAAPTVAQAATVGASTPFTSLEAESGTPLGGASTAALTAPPTTRFSSAALEASATPTSTSPAPARACSGPTPPASRSAS
ncbi:hypothetical protein ACFQ9X_10245 [Catenulispora yoronensis]